MVSFETPGIGQFLPSQGATPSIGAVGRLERVPETRVEVLCVGRDVMTGAVESLKRYVCMYVCRCGSCEVLFHVRGRVCVLDVSFYGVCVLEFPFWSWLS